MNAHGFQKLVNFRFADFWYSAVLFSFGYEMRWRMSINKDDLWETSFNWQAFRGIREISKTNLDLTWLWSIQQIRLQFSVGKWCVLIIYNFFKSQPHKIWPSLQSANFPLPHQPLGLERSLGIKYYALFFATH